MIHVQEANIFDWPPPFDQANLICADASERESLLQSCSHKLTKEYPELFLSRISLQLASSWPRGLQDQFSWKDKAKRTQFPHEVRNQSGKTKVGPSMEEWWNQEPARVSGSEQLYLPVN